jgi:hypothetical protein
LDSDTYYSDFELLKLKPTQLTGVCTKVNGCSTGYNKPAPAGQQLSVGSYNVFPLSIGDMADYFNDTGVNTYVSADDPKRMCLTCVTGDGNNTRGSWLRSAVWDNVTQTFVNRTGGDAGIQFNVQPHSLRPALRLRLDSLVLSADSSDQSQNGGGDLRLTFVQSGMQTAVSAVSLRSGVGSLVVDVQVLSGLGAAQDAVGWKLVEQGESQKVEASGVTDGAVGGSVVLPSGLDESKVDDLYVWGQENGSAAEGWSNKASEPVKMLLQGGKVKTPPSYGIEVTGITSGMLRGVQDWWLRRCGVWPYWCAQVSEVEYS